MTRGRPADLEPVPKAAEAGPGPKAPARAVSPHGPAGSRRAQDPAVGRPRRHPRRDAAANRERVLAAAVSVMLREGRHVPLATIAAEAGVGVGTLYRSYPDRGALFHALEHRAYGLLNQVLDEVDRRDLPGLDAIGEFLSRSLAVGDQLFLPLHGAPPLITAEAVQARREINRRLDRFIEHGRADGSIRAPVNATDVIVFSAILTQPLAHGPNWPRIARRQLAIFMNGLAGNAPVSIPGPAVTRQDIETTFALAVHPHPNAPSPARHPSHGLAEPHQPPDLAGSESGPVLT